LTLLDPRLSSTGYASYYTPTPAGLGPLSWRFTAGIDVYRDRSGSYNGSVLSFPANGGVTPLLSYALGTESPEPFRDELPDAPCKSWSNKSEVSAPVIVQWPQKAPSAQISAASGQLTDVSTGTVLSTCSVLGNSFADGSTARILMNAGNGITNAAFYYANVPFVAGHRYRLVVDGQAVTTFTAVTIKSAPTISVTGGDNTAAVQMDDDSTPTFRTLQLFTGANCAGGIVASWHPLGAVVTQSLGTLKSGSTYSVKSYSTDRFGSARWSNCVTFAPL
jgi:hypothetical protein